MNRTNRSYLCAIRGPVLLITLGALMAIDHAGYYSFWRTWPTLLIITGMMILLDRTLTPSGSSSQGGN